MGKVQDYLQRKKMEKLGSPKMYVVKSSPEGVDKPIECDVFEIEEDGTHCISTFPHEVKFRKSSNIDVHNGYGSGVGDNWGWTYFSTLSKEAAEKCYEEEYKRVYEKYLHPRNHPKITTTEYIICSAVQIVSTGKIYYGHRHPHCIEAMNGELSWTMNRQEITAVEKVQGFITNQNRFVDRKEAWDIAEKAKQIVKQSGGEGTLYSEDLY